MKKNKQIETAFDEAAIILKKIADGEAKNINPLPEIPKPLMTLYCVFDTIPSLFFNNLEELNEYLKLHKLSLKSISKIEYLGTVAGRNDVIRITKENIRPLLFTVADIYGYGIYNEERSFYRGEYVWEYHHGELANIYSAFKEHGLTLTDDIYGKTEERNKKILQRIKEEHLFHQ